MQTGIEALHHVTEIHEAGRSRSVGRGLRTVGAKGVIGLLMALTLVIGGCGSGGGGGGSTQLTSYKLPAELSAVPTSDTAGATLSAVSSLRRVARAITDPNSDYNNVVVRRYVEENVLRQFQEIEKVLDAVAQTKYYEQVGSGPYAAMVAFEDSEDGVNRKDLEKWVVRADAIDSSGNVIPASSCNNCRLRLRAWIPEVDMGVERLIRAEFVITTPPEKNADGSYANYGEWTCNVKFAETGDDDFYAASCSIAADGTPVVKLHEGFAGLDGPGSTGMANDVRAIMYRGETEGYGKVKYPDFEAMWAPGTSPDDFTSVPHKTASYAYNTSVLAVTDSEGSTTYKDRATVVEMTHQYGVFNASTGADVMATKSFGFPIRYQGDDGLERHSFYGAFQGRHEIWSPEGTVAEGTVVTREDVPPGQTAPTYTVGASFPGTLSMRTYSDAALSDVEGIPVEIWVHRNYNLFYQSGKWWFCPDMDWSTDPPSCVGTPVDFDAEIGLASLVVGSGDTRKMVTIDGFDPNLGEPVNYVYELASSANGDQAGFYLAEWVDSLNTGPRLSVVTPREAIDTAAVDHLFVNVDGSLFVEYTGVDTGWVEKDLAYWDERMWEPTFNESGDRPYTLPEGMQIYANMPGGSYIVERNGTTTTVRKELQTAINPSNVSTLVPSGTVFKNHWNPDTSSTFELVTDSASAKYLMLVYKTIGDDDKEYDSTGNATNRDGVAVGAVPESLWGLEATIGGATVEFNWEYDSSGGWGAQTYLVDSDENFVILDDPLRFEPIQATNMAGETKTLVLQYDGWMMGLPDMYPELSENDWTMTDEIENKIINLPAGTEVTDSDTGDSYLLKPLEVSQFLSVITDTTGLTLPDTSAGEALRLSTVPDFVEHNMGAMPADAEVLYSEGKLVEQN